MYMEGQDGIGNQYILSTMLSQVCQSSPGRLNCRKHRKILRNYDRNAVGDLPARHRVSFNRLTISTYYGSVR